jgi:hypothetical protein
MARLLTDKLTRQRLPDNEMVITHFAVGAVRNL